MSEDLNNKTRELQAKINVLEQENSLLAGQQEDLLLLSLVSDQIVNEMDEYSVFAGFLEKVSILKDVPLCAAFSLDNNCASLINGYFALQETDIKNGQIVLSSHIILRIKNRSLVISLDDENRCFLKNTSSHFEPHTALIIPFETRRIRQGIFLFLFDEKDKKTISSEVMFFERVVDIAVSKLDRITLVEELIKLNNELDKKVKEKTQALSKSLQKLRNQLVKVKQLKEQFYQAQKMEAIGKLSGSIAHDFNNLLTVINGHCELLKAGFDNEDNPLESIDQIHKAGERAANLTKQLLAFSRKQINKPCAININDLIRDIEKMLQRLIGENIDLHTSLYPDLGNIKADPNQIEQVVMNLAINARDAMPLGGTLTIKTQPVVIKKKDFPEEVKIKSGTYSQISVCDTGEGMDQLTFSHIFEPFFTTKKRGEGTGLGLSTVFGIVKQNNGFITVESTRGEGSIFHIYFPITDEIIQSIPYGKKASGNINPNETILIVDDDLSLQRLTAKILKQTGYNVLTAGNAEEALVLFEEQKGKIDLLLTDVVMPGMNGHQLAMRLKNTSPELKVLFMSGYSDDFLTTKNMIPENTEYVQKPFTVLSLNQCVREILNPQ
jgi:signal transduction histidine kinase